MCQAWHEGSFKILLLYICVCVMYVAHMRRWEDSLAELVLFYHVLSRDQTKIISVSPRCSCQSIGKLSCAACPY